MLNLTGDWKEKLCDYSMHDISDQSTTDRKKKENDSQLFSCVEIQTQTQTLYRGEKQKN
jgi:hypothetical protein